MTLYDNCVWRNWLKIFPYPGEESNPEFKLKVVQNLLCVINQDEHASRYECVIENILQPKHMLWLLKRNHFNEVVLLSIKNTC